MQVDPVRDEGRQSEQSRQVEHVGAQHHSGTDRALAVPEGGDCRCDLRTVGGESCDDSQEGFGDTKMCTESLNSRSEHPTGTQAGKRSQKKDGQSYGGSAHVGTSDSTRCRPGFPALRAEHTNSADLLDDDDLARDVTGAIEGRGALPNPARFHQRTVADVGLRTTRSGDTCQLHWPGW